MFAQPLLHKTNAIQFFVHARAVRFLVQSMYNAIFIQRKPNAISYIIVLRCNSLFNACTIQFPVEHYYHSIPCASQIRCNSDYSILTMQSPVQHSYKAIPCATLRQCNFRMQLRTGVEKYMGMSVSVRTGSEKCAGMSVQVRTGAKKYMVISQCRCARAFTITLVCPR